MTDLDVLKYKFIESVERQIQQQELLEAGKLDLAKKVVHFIAIIWDHIPGNDAVEKTNTIANTLQAFKNKEKEISKAGQREVLTEDFSDILNKISEFEKKAVNLAKTTGKSAFDIAKQLGGKALDVAKDVGETTLTIAGYILFPQTLIFDLVLKILEKIYDLIPGDSLEEKLKSIVNTFVKAIPSIKPLTGKFLVGIK